MNRDFIKSKKKSDLKGRIISRQVDKINSLQKKILDLEIDNAKKDEIINSINSLYDDLLTIVNGLKSKGDKYDRLILELIQMRNVMNQKVFKGRWKLIRFLLK